MLFFVLSYCSFSIYLEDLSVNWREIIEKKKVEVFVFFLDKQWSVKDVQKYLVKKCSDNKLWQSKSINIRFSIVEKELLLKILCLSYSDVYKKHNIILLIKDTDFAKFLSYFKYRWKLQQIIFWQK